jgi:hypothetical protein
MANEERVSMIHELLKTDADLDFLMVLRRKDLEKLVACVRARVGRVIVEKGRGRTQERKECVLCRML